MNKAIGGVVITLLLVIGAIRVFAQAPARHPDGLLTVLKAGQAIALKEVGDKYEISFFQKGDLPLGHKIIEVGGDFVVVEDMAGTREMRIPVFSIKAIILLKIGGK